MERLGTTKSRNYQFDNLEITDVRVIDVASLPPTYFLRESVIEQLKKEIRKDVLSYHKPVPPGAEGVFSGKKATARLTGSHIVISAKSRFTRRRLVYLLLVLLGYAISALIIELILRSN